MIYTQHRIGSCLSFISTPSSSSSFHPFLAFWRLWCLSLFRFFFVLAGCCIHFDLLEVIRKRGPVCLCSPSFLFVSGLDLDFFFFLFLIPFCFYFVFVLLPICSFLDAKKVSFHFWSSFFSPQTRSIKLGSHTQRGIRQQRSHRNAG